MFQNEDGTRLAAVVGGGRRLGCFPMTARKIDNPLLRIVTQQINRILPALNDTGMHEAPMSSVCPSELAASLDRAFADPEEIEKLADLIEDTRAQLSIWPNAGEARFDAESLESIAAYGFFRTLEHADDQKHIASLLLRMPVDDLLLRDALGAVFGGETVSQFWESRIFTPSVRVFALPEGESVGGLVRAAGAEPIDYLFEIDGPNLIASLCNMEVFAGRRAIYVLRSQDDPKLSMFHNEVAGAKGASRGDMAKQWAEYFACATQGHFRCGEGVVDKAGTLNCRIEDRPRYGELLASVLVVGLLKLEK